MIQSRKKHYLLFDDGSKGVVELKHEKGRTIVLDDDGFTVQDEKGNVVKVESKQWHHDDRGEGQAQYQGGEHHASRRPARSS